MSTQVVSRDRHAHFVQTLALIGASLERFATEIRHLQRTEVGEAEEPFSAGQLDLHLRPLDADQPVIRHQQGSSSMPHKRNPEKCERVCGLARLLRGYSVAALENVALWHERDISHSSVERIIGPESTILLDFMLTRLTRMLDQLIVYPDTMKKNLQKFGKLVFSEGILLKLIESGLTREEGYKLVQKQAMRSWEEGADFEVAIRGDEEIGRRLHKKDFNDVFDLEKSLRHVDMIFKRVFTP